MVRIHARENTSANSVESKASLKLRSNLAGSDQHLGTLENIMLNWALTFLIVALIAGVLGFGGVAGEAAWVAHILFVVFLVLFLVSLISGRRVPPV